MRVGDVPGEYPSVCTGPYYRVPKKKKKKKKKEEEEEEEEKKSTMHIII